MAPIVTNHMAVVYGSITLFTTILHNVFLLYHVETFVSMYKIDKASFWVGEMIFLLWNSFNDPLFGWMSDRGYLDEKVACPDKVISRRVRALQTFGPLYVLAFLLFWFPVLPTSIQFAACLCLYDGFLTMVDLHHTALMADLSVSTQARTRLNFASSVFSCLGASSVFLSYFVWSRDKERFPRFQAYCAFLTVIAFFGFVFSTSLLRNVFQAMDSMAKNKSDANLSEMEKVRKSQSPIAAGKSQLSIYVAQVKRHKNFLLFAVMNLVQVFHCHFNSNFFPLFLDQLLGDSISPTVGSFLLGLSFVLPHLNNMYFLTLSEKYGVYKVIRVLFMVKLALASLMLCFGHSYVVLLAVFIASNRIFTEGTCKLLNLVISDLVDEDFVINHRPQAVSALVFGTAALLSKPGQTLAPLVGTYLLTLHTGHDVFKSGSVHAVSHAPSGPLPSPTEAGLVKEGCFHLLVYVPIVCALVQLAVWSQFTLHGHRLSAVKARRGDMTLSRHNV